MKPIERVKQIIDLKGFTISQFEKKIGVSNNSIQTAIKKKANLKDITLNTILNFFSEINPEWLLTGKGNMLREGYKDSVNGIKAGIYGNNGTAIQVNKNGKDSNDTLDNEEIKLLKQQLQHCQEHKELLEKQTVDKDIQINEKDKQIERLLNILSKE